MIKMNNESNLAAKAEQAGGHLKMVRRRARAWAGGGAWSEQWGSALLGRMYCRGRACQACPGLRYAPAGRRATNAPSCPRQVKAPPVLAPADAKQKAKQVGKPAGKKQAGGPDAMQD